LQRWHDHSKHGLSRNIAWHISRNIAWHFAWNISRYDSKPDSEHRHFAWNISRYDSKPDSEHWKLHERKLNWLHDWRLWRRHHERS
jgi:hypothetical protein